MSNHYFEGDWPEDCEVESQEDKAIKRLLRAVRAALDGIELPNDVYGELEQAADDVASFFESDDPQQNGWVGSDGLP